MEKLFSLRFYIGIQKQYLMFIDINLTTFHKKYFGLIISNLQLHYVNNGQLIAYHNLFFNSKLYNI